MQLNSSLKELYLEKNRLINLTCEKISEIFNKNSTLELVSLIGNKIDNIGIDIILERQRSIPIKVIGKKELYGLKFNQPQKAIKSNNNNLIFDYVLKIILKN